MKNKELVSSGKMTSYLIGDWLILGIVFSIVYNFIYELITNSMESLILETLVAIILQGITVFLLWKSCLNFFFKKRTISNDDVPVVMKNLIIFTVIICLLSAALNLFTLNSTIDKEIQSELRYSESMMPYFYSNEAMKEYQEQKEQVIKEVKTKSYTYSIISQIGITTVYLAVLMLVKKDILKQIDKNNTFAY